ncbi:MAG: hypothetical protein WC824_06055 [Bacteroidota bacterium]
MKVTNISNSTIFLNDLWAIREAQNQGRRGEAQYIPAGASVYLPDTSEVLRSATNGTLSKFRDAGVLILEDTVALAANGNPGDSVVLTHGFGYPPAAFLLKQVGITWVDATGTYDAVQNATFQTITITNTTAFPLTFLIRLL